MLDSKTHGSGRKRKSGRDASLTDEDFIRAGAVAERGLILQSPFYRHLWNHRPTEADLASITEFWLQYDADTIESEINRSYLQELQERYPGLSDKPEGELVRTPVGRSLLWARLNERAMNVALSEKRNAELAFGKLKQTRSGARAQGRKRGKKPDYEAASRVDKIVKRIANDGDWCAVEKLQTILEALDNDEIPRPPKWGGLRWCNQETHVVIKAIKRRLGTW
jgi:hypothetical protein